MGKIKVRSPPEGPVNMAARLPPHEPVRTIIAARVATAVPIVALSPRICCMCAHTSKLIAGRVFGSRMRREEPAVLRYTVLIFNFHLDRS